jgi:hypothetical protein
VLVVQLAVASHPRVDALALDDPREQILDREGNRDAMVARPARDLLPRLASEVDRARCEPLIESTMGIMARATCLVFFVSAAKSMPWRSSGPTWQCEQRTPRLPAKPRMTSTSSRLPMSPGE